MLDPILSPHVQTTHQSTSKTGSEAGSKTEGNEQDFDFEDFLDVINPLQHIPIVSQIYQDKAGDEISDQAKAVGDIFYGVLTGGVFGVLSAVSNAVLKQQTDKDASEHVYAFFDAENSPESLTDSQLSGNNKEPGIKQNQASINTNAADNQSIDGNSEQISESQKDDYWSIRMRQIFGDDDYG